MVSRVFSGTGSVAPAMRRKILEVARGLGYMPNAFARGLSQQKSGIVGVLMGQIDNHFYPQVLELLAAELQKTRRQIMFFTVVGDDLESVLYQALQYRVEAVVATSVTLTSRLKQVFSGADIPVILFNRSLPGDSVYSVVCDNVAGGRAVAEALLRAGHHSFAFIGGDTDSSTNDQRRSGFVMALAEAGTGLRLSLEGSYSYAWGREAATQLLASPVTIDACFCASDLIAFGALDAFRAAGLEVPTSVSVVGFDDVPAASWEAYSLSSVRQPVQEMVGATLELLDNEVEGKPTAKMFLPSFVQRRSSRQPRD